mmetsp:Transcript_14513/g.23675  ORF Transcript_14513/g.23675 Transcript_14513/m.23675 type:complete len:324 (+) Transcript_14513:114-1085(+)
MEAEGDNIEWFIYTGQENIPRHVTHVIVDVQVIPADAFHRHPNIVEVICHEDVEIIEEMAFTDCPSLKRFIMPGVKIVEESAFEDCTALTDVECGKLEIIEQWAFDNCDDLRIIKLPSVRIVQRGAFWRCSSLREVKFGSRLQRFDEAAFYKCSSLEQITIQLKDGLFPYDDIFQECGKLMHVDLVEGELHETIAALQLEDWRKNMKEEIDSINQILPNADAGYYHYEDGDEDFGEKAGEVRRWIRSVLSKIIHYQEEHHRLLDEEVAPTLQLALPKDIAMNNVLPFLALPPHTFEVGDEGEEEDSDDEVLSADSFVEEEEEE